MMSSSRGVLPPSVLPEGAEKETLEVLQSRLQHAEHDTKQLVDQLAGMGFSYDDQAGHKSSVGSGPPSSHHDRIKPFSAPVQSSPDVLARNYEALVSRVCKAESAVHTLKMNMMRLQGDHDLAQRQKETISEKLGTATEAFDGEIKKLHRDLATSRKECRDTNEKQEEMEENTRKLQLALEDANQHQSAALVQVEEMRLARGKLERQVTNLKEELSRETSLRASLETSHQTLLQRIQEVEGIVETERSEVKTLNENYATLQRDSSKAREQTDAEKYLRLQYEDRIHKLLKDREKLRECLSCEEKEKTLLVTELGKMKTQYTELHNQLDTMSTIVEERQAIQNKLEKENKSLHEAMKTTANENAEMITKYEGQVQRDRDMVASHLQDEQLKQQLQDKLREESRTRTQAQHTCRELQAQVAELDKKVAAAESQVCMSEQQLQQQATDLRQRITLLEGEKQRALKDKQTLLDEVNAAVDGMSEERGRLEGEMEELRVELQSSQQARQTLEEHNKQLLERLAAAEQAQSSTGQIEQTLGEMLEQKNRLAYDKGKLQTRVEQLQSQLENVAGMQTQVPQLQRSQAALEAKNNKLISELSNSQLMAQRLEAQLRQAGNSGDRKEQDFMLAIQARDQALKETDVLRGKLESLEGRHRQQSEGMGVTLSGTREDHRKLTATLESVMSSHGQLQRTIEGLQVELGKRDSQMASIKEEKGELEQALRRLNMENDNLQNKIDAIETFETSEVEPLRSSLQQCKADNVKMASSLDTLLKSNAQLQSQVDGLKDKLEQAKHVQQQIKEARSRDEASHKQEIQNYEERLSNFKQQLGKERDKAAKKTNKDVTDVRRQLEDIVGKNGELSRANTELRHKITEMDYQMKEQKDKLSSQKQHIEHLNRIKKKQEETIQSLQAVGEQISDLEKIKNEYMRKTKDQARTIQSFMKQIAGLQAEIKTLATSQLDTSMVISQQEEQLVRERNVQDQWKRKFKESRKREQQLEDIRQQAETTLREVDSESMHLSSNIHDAHSWFKTKFDGLQEELTKARRSTTEYEQEKMETRLLLKEEKAKAEETARRAREMIKASRETISRLADYAEVAHEETSKQMQDMKAQLEHERDQSRRSDKRLREFQEASMRHTEELAQELSMLKNQSSSYMYDDSS